MINIELRKAIVNYLFDNVTLFNRLTKCIEHFKLYIYDDKGNYLIGGQDVLDYIRTIEKVL